MLINILTNAIKFTEAGQIRLSVSYEHEKRRLVIRVADTGMGMSTATRRHLFTPFMRGEIPDFQRVPGSGLGLALSRNLARLMGGDLRLVSTAVGEGSEFEFSVDAGAVDAAKFVVPGPEDLLSVEDFKPVDPGPVLSGRNILLVEDCEDLQYLMRRSLEKIGAKVSVADNGLDGVQTALAKDFDVVLMDMKMPKMDGCEATRALRERGYQKPIVALTANASTEDRDTCFGAGCDDYLSKPVDMNLLFRILDQRCRP